MYLPHFTTDVIKINAQVKLWFSSCTDSFLQVFKHRLCARLSTATHTLSWESSNVTGFPITGDWRSGTIQTWRRCQPPTRPSDSPANSWVHWGFGGERIKQEFRQRLPLQKIEVLAFVKKKMFLYQGKKKNSYMSQTEKVLMETIIKISNVLKRNVWLVKVKSEEIHSLSFIWLFFMGKPCFGFKIHVN